MPVVDTDVPNEACRARDVIVELLGSAVLGVYLTGSAVAGGLRPESDVDILAIVRRRLSDAEKKHLIRRLPELSGRVGNALSIRPLEVTAVSLADVVPWRYPPVRDFIYGEWLRSQYENGMPADPLICPDLAVMLAQAREYSLPLHGPDIRTVLATVPFRDVRKAIRASLPELLGSVAGDERNVILTLARMWYTIVTGDFAPKDQAAEWAASRMAPHHAALMEMACRAYRGERKDTWAGIGSQVLELADWLRLKIEKD